jgi:hypothetical protein
MTPYGDGIRHLYCETQKLETFMEKKETRNVDRLMSSGFLVGLALLLLNDFVLKSQFHNSLTGKLSDFAGLFIFPIFFTAIAPRFKKYIYIFTAILFLFWKLPLSQPVIDVWNSLSVLPVDRVVDYADLFALLILPLSFFYTRSHSIRSNRIVVAMVLPVAVFAFSATSYRKPYYEYKNDYQFNMPRSKLIENIKKLEPDFSFIGDQKTGMAEYSTEFPECPDHKLKIEIFIDAMNGISTISLREISYRCEKKITQEQLRQFFEEDLIEKLRGIK